MFDCIVPIGQTCNITFLLKNAKIKNKQLYLNGLLLQI